VTEVGHTCGEMPGGDVSPPIVQLRLLFPLQVALYRVGLIGSGKFVDDRIEWLRSVTGVDSPSTLNPCKCRLSHLCPVARV
jgi:hypothetical protein